MQFLPSIPVTASSSDGIIAGIVIGAIIVVSIYFIIQYLIASTFYQIACQKGHEERKYFHFCFWLGIVGWLMVVALPDRDPKKIKQPSGSSYAEQRKPTPKIERDVSSTHQSKQIPEAIPQKDGFETGSGNGAGQTPPEDFEIEGDTLLKYNGSEQNVVIPDGVAVIGAEAFLGNLQIRSVTIPKGVTEIKGHAFDGCIKLIEVSIPDGVTRIGDNAFIDCENLPLVKIPESVTWIGVGAFSGCKKLADVSILNENVKICNYAFADTPVQTKFKPSGGCYVATCVYGSYDCPEVWTLRRYRDHTLAATRRGRAFIRAYYAVSPTLVKWFGKTKWFKKMWQGKLDRMVKRLNDEGVENTPYQDRVW